MSKEMKYVVIDRVNPVLLSQAQQHAEFRHLNPTSAGMCSISYEGDRFVAVCYGESVSLKLKSADYDHKAIEHMFNHY